MTPAVVIFGTVAVFAAVAGLFWVADEHRAIRRRAHLARQTAPATRANIEGA